MTLAERLARAVPTGLRRRLVFLVLASVLPFVLLIGLVARNQLAGNEPEAAERASARTREIAQQLDALFRDIRSTAYALMYSISADPAQRASNERVLRSLAAATPGDAASWAVVAGDGALIGSSSPASDETDNRYLRSLANTGRSAPSGFLTEPVKMSFGHAVHMIFPMQDALGNRAQLIAQIPLRSFQPLLTAPELPGGTSIAVLSERGIIVGRSPDPEKWVGHDLSGTPLDSVARTLGSGSVEFKTQDSVPRLLTVARTTKAPLRVGVGIPTRALVAESRRDLAIVFAYGGVALVLALALALWQASQIVDPITRLSADAAKLGTGNLAHRSGVLGSDELGVLAKTINEMATTLEHQGTVLRESEERYKGLFDINPLPMWVLDPETLQFLAVNRSAREAYGYSEEEFLAMKVSDIRPPEDVPFLMRRLAELGDRSRRFVTRHKRKDGTVFPVEIDSGAIVFDGRPARLVVAHDISERIRAEEALRNAEIQLRQSQRLEAVGQLTGGIAHDFNNVLTAIGSYSDFVYESLEPDDARRLDIQEIRKAADRAAGLTKQLLAFSRSQILQPRVLDVNESLLELESLLKRLLTADLQLVFALDPDVGNVRADPGQLSQVVINLAVNARDAMADGGVLTIASRNERVEHTERGANGATAAEGVSPGDYVVIDVSDTGCGMDEGTMQKIFEPFFTTKGPGKGTGLGLSTVHGIVHQSGGHITATSRPGAGSRFSIFLPRVAQEIERGRAQPEPAASARPSEVVLVVEDEESVRHAATRILAKKGYTVIEAADGIEALDVIKRNPRIDLVLTDLVMPGMGGRELVRLLREQGSPVATLYMSGYTKDAVMRAELEPGVLVLEKPFAQEELAAKVREVLDRKASEWAAASQ